MTTKLKIDLNQGLLEVEGSESFVREIYSDFKKKFAGLSGEEETKSSGRRRRSSGNPKAKSKTKQVTSQPGGPPRASVEPTPATPKNKTPPPGPSYNYLDDLDLGTNSEHPSLVEFMDSKLPITNEERNLVFMYYLQHIIKQEQITLDHIYTCYRKVNIRAPLNLENSLVMTANAKGWIEKTDNGKMSITSTGKNYVEAQLPKRGKT